MDPINYSGAFASQSPLQAFTDSLKTGAEIQNLGLTQRLNQLKIQQQESMQKDLAALGSKPDPAAIASMSIKYPQLSEQFKRSYDMLNTEQQQNRVAAATPVYAAVLNGRTDIAVSTLRNTAAALENSGQADEAKRTNAFADLMEQHPETAATTAGLLLSHAMGAEKFKETFSGLGAEKRAQDQAPAALTKANADADSAKSDAIIKGVQAGNAPTKTVLENSKTAQEIRKSQADAKVAEFNAQIAAANSETERGRLTLERDKFVQEQAKLAQTQGNAAQDGLDSLNNSMNTLEQIKTHPGMQNAWWQMIPSVPGSKPGSTWGQVIEKIPGTDRQALSTWVDSLKSQLGFNALMAAKASSPTGASGFGALSEGELKLISQLAGNLNLNSSDFPKQLATIERFLQKGQAKAVASATLPTKGGAYVATVPGIGAVDEGHINQVLKANPGATRDQVIQFLQSIGGK